MSSNDEVLASFIAEHRKFKENGSMKSALADTKELVSYLKGVAEQLKAEKSVGADNSEDVKKSDKNIHSKVAIWQDKVTKAQKQANNHISKILKYVDNKVYEFDLVEELEEFHEGTASRLKLTLRNRNLINQVILDHLVRETSGHNLFNTSGQMCHETDNDKLIQLLEQQFHYSISSSVKNNLKELQNITNSIIMQDEPDLGPAFQWCRAHEEELKEIGSDVEFNLHELQFYLLYYGISKPIQDEEDEEDGELSEGNHYLNDVRDNHKFSAYIYAKRNFGKFLNSPNSDDKKFATASKLLTSTIIDDDVVAKYYKTNSSVGTTPKSPYTKMILRNLKNYKTTLTQLVTNFFEINKLNLHSNLYLTMMSAFVALPYIIKFNSVNKKLKRSSSMAAKSERSTSTSYDPETHGTFHQYVTLIRSASVSSQNKNSSNDSAIDNEWTSKDELPIGIETPRLLLNRHPIFICPISRQETTSRNPPVLLPCKHIISRESLNNLVESKQGINRRRRGYRNWQDTNPFEEEEETDLVENTGLSNGEAYSNETYNTSSDESYDFSDSWSESSDDSEESTQNNQSAAQNDTLLYPLAPPVVPARLSAISSSGSNTLRNYWRVSTSPANVAFKCPYCPQVCRKNQTKEVFFGTC